MRFIGSPPALSGENDSHIGWTSLRGAGQSVIAHGETQLWGFLVLFVMSISLRALLQDAARQPLGSWVCYGLLMLALLGIAGSMLWSVLPEMIVAIGIASAVTLCMVSLGFWSLQMTLLRTKWSATWARAVLVSGLWLTAWAVLTAWLRWNVGDAGPDVYE